MQSAIPLPSRASAPPDAQPGSDADLWRRLVYRWCVEYNPLYLLSAALVLGGCILLSRGLASHESLVSSLGISFVSEVYAFCLLGGAALLTRIGPRRPAVMLALLALLYQWDLTLHTETCAYLGPAGTWAAAAWVALFGVKLSTFAWALRIRFARRVLAAAAIAAIGLALGPFVVAELGGRNAGALLAIWCFALGALYRSTGALESLVELTPWGRTVLQRTTHAAWLLSAALIGAHALFWAEGHEIALSSALPVVPLLSVRGVRSERRVWAIVLGTLAIVAMVLPSAFFITSLLAAAALVLRTLSPAFEAEAAPPPPREAVEPPYRSTGTPARRPEPSLGNDPLVKAAEGMRSLAGAFFGLYLAAWTFHWASGPWPAHVLALDMALTAGVLFGAWKLRVRSPLAPLAASYAHWVVQAHLVPTPRSAGEWGAAFITLGFVLLGGSLAASYLLRPRSEDAPGGSGGPRPWRGEHDLPGNPIARDQ